MKEPTTLPDLIVKLFLVITVMYYLFGLIGYLAYGNQKIEESYFQFYGSERPLFYSFQFVYMITALFLIPSGCIFSQENFERLNLGFLSIKNEKGEFNRRNIFLMRIMLLVLSFAMVLIFQDLTQILEIGGAFITPVLSYFLPVHFLIY